MVALMDTGSTHNLLAYDVFVTLQDKSFTPVNMDMKEPVLLSLIISWEKPS